MQSKVDTLLLVIVFVAYTGVRISSLGLLVVQTPGLGMLKLISAAEDGSATVERTVALASFCVKMLVQSN